MFLVQEQACPRALLTLEGDQGRPERTGASETKGRCRTALPRARGSQLPRPPSASALGICEDSTPAAAHVRLSLRSSVPSTPRHPRPHSNSGRTDVAGPVPW